MPAAHVEQCMTWTLKVAMDASAWQLISAIQPVMLVALNLEVAAVRRWRRCRRP